MPPRWLSGIIVVFWLGTTGWLFWQDLRPRWLAGEPPLFLPDFVDEVQKKGGTPLTTKWTVERQDNKEVKSYPVFHATTSVKYEEENDAYTLEAKLETAHDPKLTPVTVAKFFKVNTITSSYRVNHAGELLSLKAMVDVRFDLAAFPFSKIFKIQPTQFGNDASAEQLSLSIQGEVRDQQFFSHCRAGAESLSQPIQFDLPPAALSYKGSVVMPLHPLNHIRGLYLGQRWRQPLVDPLRDAFAFVPGFTGGVRWLNARVLPATEILELDERELKCLVIEYTNDDSEIVGRTWVEQDGERVLQQEAILEGSRWILQRELSPRKSIRF